MEALVPLSQISGQEVQNTNELGSNDEEEVEHVILGGYPVHGAGHQCVLVYLVEHASILVEEGEMHKPDEVHIDFHPIGCLDQHVRHHEEYIWQIVAVDEVNGHGYVHEEGQAYPVDDVLVPGSVVSCQASILILIFLHKVKTTAKGEQLLLLLGGAAAFESGLGSCEEIDYELNCLLDGEE
jgi:hypothetical protein